MLNSCTRQITCAVSLQYNHITRRTLFFMQYLCSAWHIIASCSTSVTLACSVPYGSHLVRLDCLAQAALLEQHHLRSAACSGSDEPDLVRLDGLAQAALLEQRGRLRVRHRHVPRRRVAGRRPLIPLLARHADALGEGLVDVGQHLRQSCVSTLRVGRPRRHLDSASPMGACTGQRSGPCSMQCPHVCTASTPSRFRAASGRRWGRHDPTRTGQTSCPSRTTTRSCGFTRGYHHTLVTACGATVGARHITVRTACEAELRVEFALVNERPHGDAPHIMPILDRLHNLHWCKIYTFGALRTCDSCQRHD